MATFDYATCHNVIPLNWIIIMDGWDEDFNKILIFIKIYYKCHMSKHD
jgi:hypothetical protein